MPNSSLAERLRAVASRSTLMLTHYGRKSGRAYEVKIWFAVDGERIYLGTANINRQWTRNVKVRPEVAMRIDSETFQGRADVVENDAEREHAMDLIKRKYIAARLMYPLARLFPRIERQTGAFRVTLAG